MNESELNKMKVGELKAMADELGLEYASKAKKAELVEALIPFYQVAGPSHSKGVYYQVEGEVRHPSMAISEREVAAAKSMGATHLEVAGRSISLAVFLGNAHQDSFGGDVMLVCPLALFEEA